MDIPCLDNGLFSPKTHSPNITSQDPTISIPEFNVSLFIDSFENVDPVSISQNTDVDYCIFLEETNTKALSVVLWELLR